MIEDEQMLEAIIRHGVKQAVDSYTIMLGTALVRRVDYAYDAAAGVITITFERTKEPDAQR